MFLNTLKDLFPSNVDRGYENNTYSFLIIYAKF